MAMRMTYHSVQSTEKTVTVVFMLKYGKIYEGVSASGGNVVIEDLQCYGGESNVKQCASKVWLSNTCDHSQDVSIDCYCKFVSLDTFTKLTYNYYR
ncbi:hypothetical protein MAR_023631 [Mya arenaria]|uniref:SRCR domain-containing protein n=1 Tax=Mya arenaria TaxID=6604 RepID=A0ABY7DQ71_MYAAR|nr:hypothetical protein MAR_023631 [Mya arenaria]